MFMIGKHNLAKEISQSFYDNMASRFQKFGYLCLKACSNPCSLGQMARRHLRQFMHQCQAKIETAAS